jgi:hypothetical protein
MVDCQNTFRSGVMQLTNIKPAILEAQQLLQMARDLNIPFMHIQNVCRAGCAVWYYGLYWLISVEVAPKTGEAVLVRITLMHSGQCSRNT